MAGRFNEYPKFSTKLNVFSHLKNLEWFGPKYICRSNEFVFRNKTGRKKGRMYKKASSALEIDSDYNLKS